MRASDILRAAVELIDTPEKWTKEASARGASGRAVDPKGKSGVKFDTFGAVLRVGGHRAMEKTLAFQRRALPDEYGKNIGAFADDPRTTHADVMAYMERAICLAEREETQ